MPFKLRVFFDGLCHFIENREDAAPVRMCVVLPEAAEHDGVVRLRRGSLLDANGAEEPEVPLLRKRITFKYDGDEEAGNKTFKFGEEGLRGVIAMKDIASPFADENPSIVRSNPPQDVRAQVLLDRGEFKIDPGAILTTWRIPGTLREDGHKDVQVANRMFLEIDVPGEFVEINFNTLGSRNGAQTFTLTPEDGVAEITVSNECRPDGIQRAIDLDFIFHYNLLSPEALAALKRQVGGRENIPLPEQPGAVVPPQDRKVAVASLGRRGEKKLAAAAAAAAAEPGMSIQVANPDLGCNCVRSYGNDRFIGLNSFIPSVQAQSASRRTRSSAKPKP